MKVILKEDVPNLGLMGEIVNVRPGYARNYLIPRGLAVEANPRNIKQLEHYRREIERKVKKLKNVAEDLAERLSRTQVVIKTKAGEEDKLFGSVTTIDIERHLRQIGFDIDRKKILLQEPIKRLGQYRVKVKVHPDVTAEIGVVVEREE